MIGREAQVTARAPVLGKVARSAYRLMNAAGFRPGVWPHNPTAWYWLASVAPFDD